MRVLYFLARLTTSDGRLLKSALLASGDGGDAESEREHECEERDTIEVHDDRVGDGEFTRGGGLGATSGGTLHDGERP